MKSVGPYIVLREVSNMKPRTSDSEQLIQPERLAATMWATDRLTGMPVLLHPVRSANYLPELPRHPSLIHFSDILEVDGQSYLITQMDLHAIPATDPILAARGALTALTVLHEVGLVHGRLDPSELWIVDGQVVVAGAGLVSAEQYSTADDLRTLASVLEELGELPSVLMVLRTNPQTLMARDALGMLEGQLSTMTENARELSTQTTSALFDFHVPAAEDWDTVKEEESKSTEWSNSGIRSIHTYLDVPMGPTSQEVTYSRLLIDRLPTQPIFVQQMVLDDNIEAQSDLSNDIESGYQQLGHVQAVTTTALNEVMQVVSSTQQQVNTALSVSVTEGVGPIEYLLVDSLAIDLTFSQPHIQTDETVLCHQSATSSEVPPMTYTGQNRSDSSVELLSLSKQLSVPDETNHHIEQCPQPLRDPEIISERSAVPELSFDFEEIKQAQSAELDIKTISTDQAMIEADAITNVQEKIDIALSDTGHLVDAVFDEPNISLGSEAIQDLEKTKESHQDELSKDCSGTSSESQWTDQEKEKKNKITLSLDKDIDLQKTELVEHQLEAQQEKIKQIEQEVEEPKDIASDALEQADVKAESLAIRPLETQLVDLTKKEEVVQSHQETEPSEVLATEQVSQSEHSTKSIEIEQSESAKMTTQSVSEQCQSVPVSPLSLEKRADETPQQRRRRENLLLAEHERQEGEARRAALRQQKKAARLADEQSGHPKSKAKPQSRELKPIRMGFDRDGQWKVLRNEPLKSIPVSGSPSWFSQAWPVLGVLILLGLASGYYLGQELGIWPATLLETKEVSSKPKVSVVPEIPCCKVKFKISGAQKDQQAMLTVAQAPAKAKLSPGTALGTIPGQLDLPAPGVYSIRVKANGYTPHLVDVKVPTEQVVQLKLKEQ